MNNTSIRNRDNRTPNELFLGFKQSTDVIKSFTKDRRTLLTEIVPALEEYIGDFRECLEDKRKEVYDIIQKAKAQDDERKNSGFNNSSLHLQYNVGDWVCFYLRTTHTCSTRFKRFGEAHAG